MNECVNCYQLASYFCEVEISGTEEQIETKEKTTYLADDSVDLTEG